ncbi:hypothetical protein N7468_005801 [Penicillium chermesinum]|uniref:Lysozyme n=1 Tax=Penicillium chermesinum TaxID=63820 RepID=A0A9W9P0I2_9EURO|nr:uncharacterized protein N7468_005801 [Penicillium chermesinum]KAJ5232845.1 hypothetical protein N7468_005801 [Penicillium chermesinum]KAJ6172498.1 hypothetical protein N7470_001565 [Penicillium chermesinum]
MKSTPVIIALCIASAIAVPHVKRAAVNSGTLDLIGELEGFRKNFYTDSVGHTAIGKRRLQQHPCPITEAEGKKLLAHDLQTFEKCVCKLPNAKDLNANEYGALVSFTYNSGCGGADKYWSTAMSEKNFEGICQALPTTNTLGGQLNSRRAKEGAFCALPSNTTSGC